MDLRITVTRGSNKSKEESLFGFQSNEIHVILLRLLCYKQNHDGTPLLTYQIRTTISRLQLNLSEIMFD